jgi:hypothetical protein
MPERVTRAYEAAGLDSLATCALGAADERRRLGASYSDVIDERVHRVEVPAPAESESSGVETQSTQRAQRGSEEVNRGRGEEGIA